MMFPRPGCLRTLAVCLLCSVPLLSQQAGQQPPAQTPKPPPQQKKANPFETVPQSTDQPKPQAPKLEAPKPAVEGPKAETPAEDVIELVEFRGARRVPQDTLRALIVTKKGDKYDQETLNRDF